MKALEFVNIKKKFGNNIVLDNVTFEIEKKEFVGMIGNNAAGKTTIAKIASGLLKPNDGEVLVFNRKPYKDFKVKKKIGFASHNTMLYPELTVYENLRFYGSLYDVQGVDEKIEDLLKLLNLNDVKNKQVKDLSRGFKQRVAIVRALMNDPKLLILDEVTTGLDVKIRQRFLNYLFELKNTKAILFITHYDSEIKNCDRIIEVKGGRVFEKSI